MAVKAKCFKGTNSEFPALEEMYELVSFLFKTSPLYNGSFIQQIFIKHLLYAIYYSLSIWSTQKIISGAYPREKNL